MTWFASVRFFVNCGFFFQATGSVWRYGGVVLLLPTIAWKVLCVVFRAKERVTHSKGLYEWRWGSLGFVCFSLWKRKAGGVVVLRVKDK